MESSTVIHNLCNVFTKANELSANILSVEVSLSTLHLEELYKLPKTFISIVWRYQGEDLNNISSIEPFITLKQLGLRNKHILFHLPCRNLSEANAFKLLNALKDCNVRNVLVLQGSDVIADCGKRGFEHAVDLVRFIKKNYGVYFGVGVAAFPNVHPDAPSADSDLMHLKEKVNSGSDFVITQMAFDYNVFDEFYKNFKRVCPTTPLLVGMYIITSYESWTIAQRLLKKDLPQHVNEFVIKNRDNEQAILDFGIELCIDMIKKVLFKANQQILGVHFYCLNNFQLVQQVCDILGFREVHIERSPNMNSYSFFVR
ncbi:hypothetical protein RN001_007644 [Aquatica leii]|uniref:Methylenetetrahydrofolate reductase (NAD(P)H) n=1 Tax=Aquatica leii TaxID=1421715 RepID=A0AAN7QIF9_9COLE|nr:hypothetical protein RN001_007644 [Aquatica leii]